MKDCNHSSKIRDFWNYNHMADGSMNMHMAGYQTSPPPPTPHPTPPPKTHQN